MVSQRKFTACLALLGILFVQLHGLWLHKMTADAAGSMMLCPMHSMMVADNGDTPDTTPPPSQNQTSRFCPIANARDYAAILAQAPTLSTLQNAVLENRIETYVEIKHSLIAKALYNARGPPQLS